MSISGTVIRLNAADMPKCGLISLLIIVVPFVCDAFEGSEKSRAELMSVELAAATLTGKDLSGISVRR